MLTETYIVPMWLYGMPDDWVDAYFEASVSCSICLRWGNA